MTNQIIRRNKKYIYIYIYIYIYGYLINCEYFNNLNKEGDMTRTCIMAGCVHPHTHPHTQLKNSGFSIPIPILSQCEDSRRVQTISTMTCL